MLVIYSYRIIYTILILSNHPFSTSFSRLEKIHFLRLLFYLRQNLLDSKLKSSLLQVNGYPLFPFLMNWMHLMSVCPGVRFQRVRLHLGQRQPLKLKDTIYLAHMKILQLKSGQECYRYPIFILGALF